MRRILTKRSPWLKFKQKPPNCNALHAGQGAHFAEVGALASPFEKLTAEAKQEHFQLTKTYQKEQLESAKATSINSKILYKISNLN